MKKLAIDNFTAVLPVTCNANCGFCPEKEMEHKANKEEWIDNLVDHVNRTWHMGYDHISLSGGEPTLDLRFLFDTLGAIYERTPCKRVGITTNGKFLENAEHTRKLIEFLNTTAAGSMVYFINISRHALDTASNNKIMAVNYRYRLADIANFRQCLKHVPSFRLNMVMTESTNYEMLFGGLSSLNGWFRENRIDVALRSDYNLDRKADELVPGWIKTLFERYFGNTARLGGCPTCVTFGSKDPRYNHLILKGSNFEPTDHDITCRDLIQHQDGQLYYDWQRNRPFDENDDLLWGELAPTIQMTGVALEPEDDALVRIKGDKLLVGNRMSTIINPYFTEAEIEQARREVNGDANPQGKVELPFRSVVESSTCGGPAMVNLGNPYVSTLERAMEQHLIPIAPAPGQEVAREIPTPSLEEYMARHLARKHTVVEESTSCGTSGCSGGNVYIEPSECGHIPDHSNCGHWEPEPSGCGRSSRSSC